MVPGVLKWWVFHFTAGAWFFYPKADKGSETAKTDIKAPVNNRATISIEGSRQIVLAEAPTGTIY